MEVCPPTIRYPVGLDASDVSEIQKIVNDNPTLPYYFAERIYRYIKNNPEEAEKVANGEIVLPQYDRSNAFISDEEKIKLRTQYREKCEALGLKNCVNINDRPTCEDTLTIH